MQVDQHPVVRDAPVQRSADMPFEVGARGNQVLVHGPVHVWRQGQTIAGIVVLRFAERVDMGGFDQSGAVVQHQPDAGGRAAVVVQLRDDTAKRRVAHIGGRGG